MLISPAFVDLISFPPPEEPEFWQAPANETAKKKDSATTTVFVFIKTSDRNESDPCTESETYGEFIPKSCEAALALASPTSSI
jgi:hypothetical protein